MTEDDPAKPATREPASSPCMLHELDEHGNVLPDPVQARDVARWRKAERKRLLEARRALAPEYRAEQARKIARGLDSVLADSRIAVPAVSVYWPIAAEPDLRPWMEALHRAGVTVALPVTLALGQVLTFREWHPGATMSRGLWNLPYPADGRLVIPNVTIAPLVGFDRQCYRLGFGGGFFDRTLAALRPKPLAVGIGYPAAAIPTIFPQAHDIRMDWIVTGDSTLEAKSGPAAG